MHEDAPPVANLPGTHKTQLVCPSSGCARPGLHNVQLLERAKLKDPAEQLVHTEAPGPENVPAEQVKHWLDMLYGL